MTVMKPVIRPAAPTDLDAVAEIQETPWPWRRALPASAARSPTIVPARSASMISPSSARR
ncbi:hypothetical protein [Streptomyces parvus]|uniref:hypothetical protein n=1 Tax=Streptomyces parvus TaxID=66428 RepID=UPI003D74B8B6